MVLEKTDYTKLSVDELKAVITNAEAELNRRKQTLRQEAVEKIKAIAEEAGLNLADVAKGARKSRSPVPAKYRNPDNVEQTWSGRGKKPRWLVEALDAGGKLVDFTIEALPCP
jgi:DNA-binding protein H-NS